MRRIIWALALAASIAQAGEISGTVAGAKEGSVIYVEAVPGKTFPAPKNIVTITQKKQTFIPHVSVIQAGATVDFLNQDYMRHSIYWPDINGDKKLAHSMGSWHAGDKRSFQFMNAGVVPLLCNVHNEMRGFIVVTPTPYSAETGATGAFHIAGVPNGSYKVTAWHEGLKPQTLPVKVTGKAVLAFQLSK